MHQGGQAATPCGGGMAERSNEEMAKEYINSIMYAVPDVALMVPRTRPIKRCAVHHPPVVLPLSHC